MDVSSNTALTRLSCYINSLTSLDVSKNTALTRLDFSNNKLTSLNVANGNNNNFTLTYGDNRVTNSFKVTRNPNLICIQVDDVSYSTANWYNKDATASYSEDCSSFVPPVLSTTKIPDSNFERKLISLGYDSGDIDGLVYTDNIAGITSLDVSNFNTPDSDKISNLSGIEDFVALTRLYCFGNQLTNLDISSNTALTYLSCYNNQLIELNVSANTALTYLFCSSNQLTSLNVKNGNNARSSTYRFRVINNPDLSCIQVDDVSYSTTNWINKDATASYSENCSTLSLTTNPASLLTSTSATLNGEMTSNGRKIIIKRGFVYSLSNTDLTTTGTDVTKAVIMGTGVFSKDIPDLNPNTLYYYKAYATNSVETAYGAMVSFTTTATIPTGTAGTTGTAIPDPNFEQALIDLDIDSGEIDGFVLTANISGLTRLSVFAKGTITSLKGIEAFTSLTYLSCGYNQLTSLDVSKNTALTILACSSNQLTSLDVSKNTALTILACSSNQLTSLDVSKNTALTYFLDCRDNQLTSLDISKNTDLTILTCAGNQLSELNVSKNTALTLLYCGNNQLTSLNVSENTALTELYCSGNQLSELNLSANMTLTHLQCST